MRNCSTRDQRRGRSRSRVYGFALLSAILMTACSQTLVRHTCLTLAEDVDYCLAPITQTRTQAGAPTTKAQRVVIEVNGSRHELMSLLEMSNEQLTLVGLAPLGQALFSVQYGGGRLTSEQSQLLGDQFKAEYLLAMLQLIYWPQDSVNRYLQGAQLRSEACDAPMCRNLYARQSEPLIEIRYSDMDPWVSRVDLSMPAAQFALSISPL